MATAYKFTQLNNWIARGGHEFFSVAVNLTPEMAADLLERNPANRSIAQNRVEIYAADIMAGRWSFNGEPIIVSRDGRVTNGQHRCHAVIKAGLPIFTAISFGVDYESRKTTDQLRPKAAGDFAAMDGIANAQGMAAIARLAMSYDEVGSFEKRGITHAAVLDYMHRNIEELTFCASFSHARVKRLHGIAPPSVMGFCHFVMRRINTAAADEYISQVIHGDGLALNDPALVVRNRLISSGRGSKQFKAEIICHGWNAFRRGNSRTIIKSLGRFPELV